MKRRAVKISLVVTVAVVILLGLLVVLAWDWDLETSFGFLDGRTMTGRIEQARNSRKITREVYSFEADFNDVCAKADAELSALGFRRLSEGNQEPRMRDYLRKKSFSVRWVNVRVIDRLKFSAGSAPKSSENSNPDRWEYRDAEGWVSIEIQRVQRQFWPPHRVLDHVHTPSSVPSRPPPEE